MGNMSPYYFKTIFTLSIKYRPSFIEIGGAVSEKSGDTGQTFVVLYIGYDCLCLSNKSMIKYHWLSCQRH